MRIIGVQGWLSGSLVMMLKKSYGMFWVQTQPCTPEQLEKKVLPLTTQCVCMDLIVMIARDCVVCACNDSVGPRKSSLWLSGSPHKIR